MFYNNLGPEQLENKYYSIEVDIYAIGLIFLELCCIFSTQYEKITTFSNLRKYHTLPDEVFNYYPLESKLILSMTQKLPENRPSIKEVLMSETYKELKNKYKKDS